MELAWTTRERARMFRTLAALPICLIRRKRCEAPHPFASVRGFIASTARLYSDFEPVVAVFGFGVQVSVLPVLAALHCASVA